MGAPQLSRLYIGCRTRDRKLIRRYDLTSNRLLGRELYDLRSDPYEVDDRYGDLDASPLPTTSTSCLIAFRSAS
jgi:hypothetical protein